MKNDMQFTGKNGEFQIRHMVEKTQLNFPVANEEGINSSVTQTFGGDCKLDQNHFLLEPVSIEICTITEVPAMSGVQSTGRNMCH